MSITTKNCQKYRVWHEGSKMQSKESERAEIEVFWETFIAQNRLWVLAKKSDYR